MNPACPALFKPQLSSIAIQGYSFGLLTAVENFWYLINNIYGFRVQRFSVQGSKVLGSLLRPSGFAGQAGFRVQPSRRPIEPIADSS